MKKKAISLALALSLTAATPSFAIIGSIINAVQSVIDAVKTAIKVTTVAQELYYVATFPSEYVQEVNAIIKDINALKAEAQRSGLPAGDIKFFLNTTSTTLLLTKQSLESFNKIMKRLEAIESDLTASATDSEKKMKYTEIENELAAMRREHRGNIQALHEVRSMISNMRAVLSSSQVGKRTIDKLNNFNL